MSGKTIRIAFGSTPKATDGQLAVIRNVLQSWGAKASIINQTGDPAAVRVLLAGQADICFESVSGGILPGLVAFGPYTTVTDYHLIGAPDLQSVSDLPGHIYGTSNEHGAEALMFALLLAHYNIPADKVTVKLAGGSDARVAAMSAHQIDATFLHANQIQPLTSHGFNDLASMATVAPDVPNAVAFAPPQWLKDNPDLAVAVDEAWIVAAGIFNTDESQWVSDDVAYTSSAGGTSAEAEDAYEQLKKIDTFPSMSSAFTEQGMVQTATVSHQVGAIATLPEQSSWLTTEYWEEAVAAYHLP